MRAALIKEDNIMISYLPVPEVMSCCKTLEIGKIFHMGKIGEVRIKQFKCKRRYFETVEVE